MIFYVRFSTNGPKAWQQAGDFKSRKDANAKVSKIMEAAKNLVLPTDIQVWRINKAGHRDLVRSVRLTEKDV